MDSEERRDDSECQQMFELEKFMEFVMSKFNITVSILEESKQAHDKLVWKKSTQYLSMERKSVQKASIGIDEGLVI